MNSQNSHYQTQAITILAIATAVIGFGLFGSDQLVGIRLLDSPQPVLMPVLKLAFGLIAFGLYGVLTGSVSGLLKQESPVTGRQVAHGPLLQMSLIMVSVASIFVTGIFEMPQDPS